MSDRGFEAAMAAQAARLRASGVALPPVETLRNSGASRTPEKRALLALLEEKSKEQGRECPFPQQER